MSDNDTNESGSLGVEEKITLNPKPQSLLSIPLLKDDNLLKNNFFQNNNNNYNINQFIGENNNIGLMDGNQDNDDDDDEDDDDEDDDDDDDDDDEEVEDEEKMKTEAAPPKSLLDLFGNPSANQMFIDPTITEKENSKPNLKEEININNEKKNKKMSKKQRQELKRQRKELGIVSKKQQKKIEYKKKFAEKQKRELEWKDKLKETLCKFYLEGRCTKGDDCQFSHNAPVNKKLEVCKYYLNGYCAKGSNCTYMHAEFPCKFYHMNNKECLNGANCRFSHAPMTNEMRELFEKYVKDNDDNSTLKKSSLLGSPPRHLQGDNNNINNKSNRTGLLPLPNISPIKNSQSIPSLLSKNLSQQQFSIPSLMDISISNNKPVMPTQLMSNDIKPPQSQFFCQDIDERCPPVAITSLIPPLLPPSLSSDIDERAPPSQLKQQQHMLSNIIDPTNLNTNNLIAKLLQQKHQPQHLPSLVNDLITSLTNPVNLPAPATVAPMPGIGESLLNSLFKQIKPEDPVDNVYTRGNNELTIDDDADESLLVIDARTNGLIPYNIQLIDIEPSSLWSNPPFTNTSSKSDSQCVDPRIEFYSNKLNNKYLNDTTLSTNTNGQQQNSQSLTSSLLSSASSPPQSNSNVQNEENKLTQKVKDYRDPRLSSTKLNTMSSSNELNEFLNSSSNTKPNSLLSSLPDFKLPFNKAIDSSSGNSALQQQIFKGNDSNNVVKLTIQDYKRKKTGNNDDFTTSQNILNKFSYYPRQQHQYQQEQQQEQQTNSFYLPQVSSFSVTNSLNDITPPQCKSLHELLKDFRS